MGLLKIDPFGENKKKQEEPVNNNITNENTNNTMKSELSKAELDYITLDELLDEIDN